MQSTRIASVAVCILMVAGCVSKGTHTQTLSELEQSRKASAQTIEALQQEKTRLSNELLAASS